MGDQDFEFSAPQYIDNLENAAENSEKDSLDSYFNVRESLGKTPAKNEESLKDIFMTPLDTPKYEIKAGRSIKKASRKSMMNGDMVLKDLTNLTKSLSLGVAGGIFEGIALHPQSAKKHQMKTRRDSEVEALTLRSRHVKRKTLGGWAEGAISGTEGFQVKRARYVSLAEAILKFEVSTPPRFKKSLIKGKEQLLPNCAKSKGGQKLPTIPVTPNLATKKRVRIAEVHKEEPLSHIPKINPLNPKVFEKPKAFVRTEVHPPPKVHNFKPKSPQSKKEPAVKDETFTFKARPVPKSVLAPRPMMIRIPSNVKKNGDIAVEEMIVATGVPRVAAGIKITKNKNSHFLPIKTSYERGQEHLVRKKEQELKKAKEEAKKNITNFKARPAPSFITAKNATLNCSTLSHSCKENREDHFQFKARGADVLHKKPFQPKKPEKVLIEVNEFNFTTEKRLKQRQEFEKKIKEREEVGGVEVKKVPPRFSIMPKPKSH